MCAHVNVVNIGPGTLAWLRQIGAGCRATLSDTVGVVWRDLNTSSSVHLTAIGFAHGSRKDGEMTVEERSNRLKQLAVDTTIVASAAAVADAVAAAASVAAESAASVVVVLAYMG